VAELKGATLVFDLESQRLVHEVGGWEHAGRLGLAAAVTLDAETGRIQRFVEADAPRLIECLRGAGRVIGCNLIGFDYLVLAPYGLDPSELAEPGRTLDLLDSLARALGYRVPLENVASATLGEHKSADGVAAVAWYRQGLLEKVLDYCEQDVRVTHRLWEHGRSQKYVRCRDANFRLRQVPVSW
jgi:DEAD/DEAH box helicase domain-containing protein